MTPPWLIALAFVIGLIVLVPARRLQIVGFSSRAIGSYALLLWLFAMAIAIRPGATRVLIPFLLVAYVAPFVAGPDTVRRVLRRPAGGASAGAAGTGPDGQVRPPIKNVTPPEGSSGGPDQADGPPDGDRQP